MDNVRLLLIGAILFIGWLMYEAWLQDYPPPATAPAHSTQVASSQGGKTEAELPPIAAPAHSPSAAPETPLPAQTKSRPQTTIGKTITVTTDVMRVELNTSGGVISKAGLLKYPVKQDKPDEPVVLLTTQAEHRLVLQTGLRGSKESAAPGEGAMYEISRTDYQLGKDEKELTVSMTWQSGGIKVIKSYIFHRGQYRVDLRYKLENSSGHVWQGDQYVQFQTHYVPADHSIFSVARYNYTALGLHDSEGYHKYDFKELGEKPLARNIAAGWLAVVQHYFVAAAIPGNQKESNNYYSRNLGEQNYLAGYVTPLISVESGSNAELSDTLFLGPKLQDRLAGIAPGLDRTVDYGKFTVIAQPLFWVLHQIYLVIGNWGWSIIILTLILKILFYWPNMVSFRSMAKIKKVQPRLKALQERYKDDKPRLQKAMMEFYKTEKINPASGCMPILIQIPIFFALFYVLIYSVELRQAHWILWIKDLSAPDPFYVLPLLYGIFMFIQQRINPQPTDKMQARIMMGMPLALTVFYVVMPAGLVLYYVVNMILTIAQQRYIYYVIDQEELKKRR